MKIAVVSNMYPDNRHPSYGVFVKNFCSLLDTMGIEHTDYVMHKSDSAIEKIIGYIVFYIGTAISLLVRKYDLIYVHYASHSSIPVLIVNKVRKLKVYTNVHGSDVVPENKTQERMQKYTKKLLLVSDKVIVPSEYFKDLVSEKYGIEKERIYVSPSGGVDDKVFFKEKDKEFGKILKLGYVGRISHQKGWDVLLKACASLSVPYVLKVVGNGPEYKEMIKLADCLHIYDKIIWSDIQPQEKLRGIYNDLDVFIFPTKRKGESLGLVAIEAMACGTPVIASDFAAPRYYISDKENGLKFKCGDERELKKCIEYFYGLGIDERKKMAQNGLETAKKYYSDAILEGIYKILELC